jgi:tetratricopeptide (TPR) repeat protein
MVSPPSSNQQDLTAILRQGLAEFNTGNFAGAEAAYQRVLATHPNQPDALHLLGLVAYSVGKFALAVELIQRAISFQPGNANFHNNIGNAFRSLGRATEALESYQRALTLEPSHIHAQGNVGTAYYDIGEIEKAIASYRKALTVDANNVETLNNLSIALKDIGETDESISVCRKAININQNFADGWNSLGNGLIDADQSEKAIDAYQRAIQIRPNYAEAYNNLGFALNARGTYEDAIKACRQAIALRPDYALAYLNLGLAQMDLGWLDDGIAALRKAVAIDPGLAKAFNALGVALYDKGQFEDSVVAYREALALESMSADVYSNLGASLETLGQYNEAIENYHKSIELAPDRPEAYNNLGIVLETVGRFDNAVEAFDQALLIRPGYAEAYKNLSSVVDFHPDNPRISEMKKLLNSEIPSDDKLLLSFALGKAYENTKRYEEAFDAYKLANSLYRQTLKFDVSGVGALFQRISASFDEDFLSGHSNGGCDSELPIFIVGMPRSGTSLVEQILASHPQVHGAGELRNVSRIALDLPQRFGLSTPYPECIAQVPSRGWCDTGQSYVNDLRQLSPDSARVTDKMPSNYQYIGLIDRMLPKATIVHCMRDPVDTCLSCFKTLFREGQLYSFDLTELGLYYQHYKRLEDHWRQVLPGRMLDIRYEDVIQDLEGSARRLIAHCGLEWDDACLDFHTNKRPVHTASAGQVRRPIYKSSMGQWHRYEKQLAPLLEALGPLVEQYAHDDR